MSDLAKAAAAVTPSKAVAGAWQMIVRAIDAGWIDSETLGEMLDELDAQRDYGVEELIVERRGTQLHMKFLDESADCDRTALLALARQLLAGTHPGTVTYLDGDKVVSVDNVADIPGGPPFANTEHGKVPVVKVVMQRISETQREIMEYGPAGQLLRSTMQLKN